MYDIENMALQQRALEILGGRNTRKKSKYEHLGLCVRFGKENG